MEELLDPVFELVGLFLAHVLDPGPVVAERGIAHRGLQLRVIDAVELEREKQKMQRGRRDALLDVAVELRARRIGGIAGIHQRCIGHQPAKPVVDRFIARDRFRKPAPPRSAASAASRPLKSCSKAAHSLSASSRSRFTSGLSSPG